MFMDVFAMIYVMFKVPICLLKVKVVAEVVGVRGVACDTCGGGGDGACLRDGSVGGCTCGGC